MVELKKLSEDCQIEHVGSKLDDRGLHISRQKRAAVNAWHETTVERP